MHRNGLEARDGYKFYEYRKNVNFWFMDRELECFNTQLTQPSVSIKGIHLFQATKKLNVYFDTHVAVEWIEAEVQDLCHHNS